MQPTGNGNHGYIDPQGFVRDEQNGYTGWRAVNFFPYAIFTPLSGSVSGIYLRLPVSFMNSGGAFDLATYRKNLELLELNVKNRLSPETNRYAGDAGTITIKPGFYPVGTEFAHPLHYVDLLADGDVGAVVDGISGQQGDDYEFPGSRSKRIKEIRYLYKWKNVGLADISDEAMETKSTYPWLVGRKDQGWIDNKMGWILAAYIENRNGDLRPQTTESWYSVWVAIQLLAIRLTVSGHFSASCRELKAGGRWIMEPTPATTGNIHGWPTTITFRYRWASTNIFSTR